MVVGIRRRSGGPSARSGDAVAAPSVKAPPTTRECNFTTRPNVYGRGKNGHALGDRPIAGNLNWVGQRNRLLHQSHPTKAPAVLKETGA
jgi:hypothetical protein